LLPPKSDCPCAVSTLDRYGADSEKFSLATYDLLNHMAQNAPKHHGGDMKKTLAAGALALGALLTGCSGNNVSENQSYKDLDALFAAAEKAGIECEPDAADTDMDGGGKARTCNDSMLVYVYPDAETNSSWVDLVDSTRQGIMQSTWVVGENFSIISNEEEAAGIAEKLGGKVTVIGSK